MQIHCAQRNYGRTALCEFLGDQVVYRNLEPCDPRLPGLKDLRATLGLPAQGCTQPGCTQPGIPRKTDLEYARVIVHLLHQAQQMRGVSSPIKRLLLVGDTRLLDGSAFANICLAGEWPGLAFIGSENSQPASIEIALTETGQPLYLANRWAALADFDRFAMRQPSMGVPVDESTAILVDIDKTALGARGRNAQVIDQARLQAVQNTVATLLGSVFNLKTFQATYDLLNQPEFHPFTTDNQDYLAYICLIVVSGLYPLEDIVIRSQQKTSFVQFISEVDHRRRELPARLVELHDEIYDNVKAGDPTPFKSFRRNEYLATITRFGQLDDNASLQDLLVQEILVTQEVRAAAIDWRRRGALLLGLSDKPDEAAIPTPELADLGYLPIHRAITHAVGDAETT